MKAIITSIETTGANLGIHYSVYTEPTDQEHSNYIVDQEVVSAFNSVVVVPYNISKTELEDMIKKRMAQLKNTIPAVIDAEANLVGLEIKA